MIEYTDPLQAKGVVPPSATYQQIDYSVDIQLIWQNQVTIVDNQYVVTANIDLAPSVADLKVYLPVTANQATGANFILNNITDYPTLIYTADDVYLFTINPTNSNSPDAMYLYIDSDSNWRFRVQGSSSNVSDITQIIGNGLQVNLDTNNEEVLTVKSNSAPIENVLTRLPGSVKPIFTIDADATAMNSISYTAIITDSLGGQAVVLLDYSYLLAQQYGYSIKFINASGYPAVLQTKVGDSINGQSNQSSTGGNYASFILQSQEACEVLSTKESGWRVNVTNSLLNKTYNTTNININAAQINVQGGDYWVDFSGALDVAYSSILVVTGNWDTQTYPISQGQGVYFVMPNNLSTLYFMTSLLEGYTNFKLGLGVRLSPDSVYLENTAGRQMNATPQGAVGFTYLCYESNGGQVTDISPLAVDIGSIQTAPTGMVTMFAGQTAPSGWLICDGSEISRLTYSALFAVIGITYGEGDGVGTFNLPNTLGMFVRGWDSGGDVDPNREFGSIQDSDNKEHNHNFTGAPHTHANSTWTDQSGHIHGITDPQHDHDLPTRSSFQGNTGGGDTVNDGSGMKTGKSPTNITINNAKINNGSPIPLSIASATQGGTVGNTGGAESRPINVAMNYIIKI